MSDVALAPATVRSASPVTVAPALCKACGICIAFCPKHCLDADSDGKAYLASPELCSRCGLCEVRCPDFAVKVEARNGRAKPR